MRHLKPSFYIFYLVAASLAFLLLPLHGQANVIADHLDKVYHREDCPLVKNIKARNLREIDSEAEADAKGYFPCEKCITPVRQPSFTSKEIKKLSLPVARENIYIGDKKEKIYHHQWCELAKQIESKNQVRFSTAKEASEREYKPCKECNPPVMFQRNKVVPAEVIPITAPPDKNALPEPEMEE